MSYGKKEMNQQQSTRWVEPDFNKIIANQMKDVERLLTNANKALQAYNLNPNPKETVVLRNAVLKLGEGYGTLTKTFTSNYKKGKVTGDAPAKMGDIAGNISNFNSELTNIAPNITSPHFRAVR